jgi:hypothetical protein
MDYGKKNLLRVLKQKDVFKINQKVYKVRHNRNLYCRNTRYNSYINFFEAPYLKSRYTPLFICNGEQLTLNH